MRFIRWLSSACADITVPVLPPLPYLAQGTIPAISPLGNTSIDANIIRTSSLKKLAGCFLEQYKSLDALAEAVQKGKQRTGGGNGSASAATPRVKMSTADTIAAFAEASRSAARATKALLPAGGGGVRAVVPSSATRGTAPMVAAASEASHLQPPPSPQTPPAPHTPPAPSGAGDNNQDALSCVQSVGIGSGPRPQPASPPAAAAESESLLGPASSAARAAAMMVSPANSPRRIVTGFNIA